jgi:hypothetical protein
MSRKKRNVCLLLLSAICAGIPLEARKLSPEEAQEKAFRSWQQLIPLRADQALRLAYTGTDSLLWGYEVEQGEGFVVISGDDRARTVLAYGLEGGLQRQEMPENMLAWLNFYEKEIRLLPVEDETEEKVREQPALRDGVGEILLETPNWDQQHPYNIFCPSDLQTGQKAAAGCVATAMAEVMYYHRWPEYGSKNSVYMYVNGNRQNNYESFVFWYDWNNMIPAYKDENWTVAQTAAVGRLIYHCGRATDMNYSPSGSGAMSFAMQKALIDNFGYRADCRLAFRDLYGRGEWEEIIREEIAQNRPVLYSGVSSDGGHMFVVDGFRENGFFHVNWGWSGKSNGYFVLSALNPSEQGTGGSTGGEDSGFNSNQDALLGLSPSTGEEEEKKQWEIFFSFITKKEHTPGLYASTEKIERGRYFKIYYTGLLNYGYRTYTGYFLFVVEDSLGVMKETISQINWGAQRGNLSPNVIYNAEWGLQVIINTEICEGDRIRLYYTLEDGSLQPVRGEEGARLSIELHPSAEQMGVDVPDAIPLDSRCIGCYDLTGREIPCGEGNLPYVEVRRDQAGRITSSLRLHGVD